MSCIPCVSITPEYQIIYYDNLLNKSLLISSDIAVILSFSGFLLGSVIVLILISVNPKFTYANFLLAVCVFSFAYLMFVSGLIASGLILKVPHFFRTASPFIYIIAPAAYLYVRTVLDEEVKFSFFDLLHFTPAIFHFVELTPFFLKSAETKINILEIIFIDPDYSLALQEGFLPQKWHSFLKTIIGLIYFSFQFYIIRQYTKKNHILDSYQEKIIQWLDWFTLMLISCYSLLLVSLFTNNESYSIHHLLTVVIASTLLIILIYLFLQPQILYGLADFSESENLANEILSQTTDNRNLSLSADQISDYRYRIEKYLETKKPYLDSSFRMQDMVEDTCIQRHHLSATINTVYQMNFNGLINKYRVNYIKKNIHAKKWSNLSLEGIGMEAGFKSRSTFLQSFKKETGMTPSVFREINPQP
ncbi:MAG: AraC family transcriptional regulator [Mongoliibacter sp.]|nr:MAG: AraC family transcriptional regulator [Mongoliibacter sp.]